MADEGTKKVVGCIYAFGIIYLIGGLGGLVTLLINESYNKDLIYVTMIIVTISLAIAFAWYIDREKEKARAETQNWKNKASHSEHEFKLKRVALDRDFKKKEDELRRIEKNYYDAIKSKSPFSYVSEMFVDWESACYDGVSYFLRHKPHPAIRKAQTIEELKEKYKATKRSEKEMKYKYSFLLNAFPDLKRYFDDEETLVHLSDYKDYEEFRNESDEVLDFISVEEYKAMTVTQRNQLALDRFKQRNKSDWQVGMLYEMYIGHLLRKSHFSVIQYGIENGLFDLGRDIIASRIENGIRYIYIIQCKNWSRRREVHENVVCQLYGTTVQYELMNRDLFSHQTKVVPWLVITNELSDMAQKFANKLGVKVSVRPMQDFPMIKCNINNGNKIYHLPFDQQYYRTQIKLPGEFYAWTVKEAMDAGFRRARRHII